MGDNKIHSFYRIWFMMTKECEVPLPERTLRNMLARKLEASVKLKEDLAYYHRLPEDDKQKTYAYLIHAMERLMARTQETTNFENRKKGFKALTGQGGTQNALATETAGSGKDKGKGKGKGKGRGKGDAGGGTGSTAADPLAATAKDGRRFCVFHVRGNCTRAECPFSHDTPPKAVAEAIKNHQGPLGRSRSPSPAGRRPRSAGRQRPQNGETAAPALQTATAAPAATGRGRTVQEKFGGLKQLWCPFNLKGNCKKGDNCPLPHIPAESKNAIQKSIARAMEIQKAAADSAAAASSQ